MYCNEISTNYYFNLGSLNPVACVRTRWECVDGKHSHLNYYLLVNTEIPINVKPLTYCKWPSYIKGIQGNYNLDSAIAEATSRWLPTAAARLRGQFKSSGICDGQSSTGAGFLPLLRFSISLKPPTDPHSTSSGACRIGQNTGRHPIPKI
jgi:hypothetical protein